MAALFDPFGNRALVDAYAAAGFEALSMEFMPRITRAQSMDVLSLAIEPCRLQGGAGGSRRLWPRLPDDDDGGRHGAGRARFHHGCGCCRLASHRHRAPPGRAGFGDPTCAPRPRKQIQSLGAKPIFVENVAGIEGEGSGGYATEMSEEYQKAQAELVSSHIAKQDIVITTALIPGRAAPRLITDAQIATMKPGQRDLRSRRGAGRQCGRIGAGSDRGQSMA